MGVGQKWVPLKGTQNGTLANGSKDQNLLSPGDLILTHTQIRSSRVNGDRGPHRGHGTGAGAHGGLPVPQLTVPGCGDVSQMAMAQN